MGFLDNLSELGGEALGEGKLIVGVDSKPLKAGLDQIGQTVESHSSKWGAAFKIAQVGLVGLATAFVGFAIEGTKKADELDAAVARISAQVGLLPAQSARMRQGLLDMSTRTTQGVDELAKSIESVAKAGFDVEDSLRIQEASARVATVTHADLATVTNTVVTAMKAWHIGAKDVGKVTDTLITTVGRSRIDFDALSRIIATAAPIAKDAGVSFADLNAAIIAVGRSGLPARRAAAGVIALIRSLSSPAAQKEMALLGITVNATTIAHDGLLATLQKIDAASGGHVSVIVRTKGAQEALTKASEKARVAQLRLTELEKKGTASAATMVAARNRVADANRALAKAQAAAASGGIDYAKSEAATAKANKGQLQAMQAMVGGAAGLVTADVLLADGAKDFKAGQDALNHSLGKTNEEFERVKEADLGVQLSIFRNQITKIAIDLGTQFLPYVARAIHWMTETLPGALRGIGDLWNNVLREPIMAMLSSFLGLAKAIGSVFGGIIQTGGGGGPVTSFFRTLAGIIADIARDIGGVFDVIRNLINLPGGSLVIQLLAAAGAIRVVAGLIPLIAKALTSKALGVLNFLTGGVFKLGVTGAAGEGGAEAKLSEASAKTGEAAVKTSEAATKLAEAATGSETKLTEASAKITRAATQTGEAADKLIESATASETKLAGAAERLVEAALRISEAAEKSAIGGEIGAAAGAEGFNAAEAIRNQTYVESTIAANEATIEAAKATRAADKTTVEADDSTVQTNTQQQVVMQQAKAVGSVQLSAAEGQLVASDAIVVATDKGEAARTAAVKEGEAARTAAAETAAAARTGITEAEAAQTTAVKESEAARVAATDEGEAARTTAAREQLATVDRGMALQLAAVEEGETARTLAARTGALTREGSGLAGSFVTGETAALAGRGRIQNALGAAGGVIGGLVSKAIVPILIAQLATDIAKAPIGDFVANTLGKAAVGAKIKEDFFGGLVDLAKTYLFAGGNDAWVGKAEFTNIGSLKIKTLELAKLGVTEAQVDRAQSSDPLVSLPGQLDITTSKFKDLGRKAGESVGKWYERVRGTLDEATQKALEDLFAQTLEPLPATVTDATVQAAYERSVAPEIQRVLNANYQAAIEGIHTGFSSALGGILEGRGFTAGSASQLTVADASTISALASAGAEKYGFLLDFVAQKALGQVGGKLKPSTPSVSGLGPELTAGFDPMAGMAHAGEILRGNVIEAQRQFNKALDDLPEGQGAAIRQAMQDFANQTSNIDPGIAQALARKLGAHWQEAMRDGTEKFAAAPDKAMSARLAKVLGKNWQSILLSIGEGSASPATIKATEAKMKAAFGANWKSVFSAAVSGTTDQATVKEMVRLFGPHWREALGQFGTLLWQSEGGKDRDILIAQLKQYAEGLVAALTAKDLLPTDKPKPLVGEHGQKMPTPYVEPNLTPAQLQAAKDAVNKAVAGSIKDGTLEATASPDVVQSQAAIKKLGEDWAKAIPDPASRTRFIDQMVALQKTNSTALKSNIFDVLPTMPSHLDALTLSLGKFDAEVRAALHMLGGGIPTTTNTSGAKSQGGKDDTQPKPSGTPIYKPGQAFAGGGILDVNSVAHAEFNGVKATIGEAGREEVAIVSHPRQISWADLAGVGGSRSARVPGMQTRGSDGPRGGMTLNVDHMHVTSHPDERAILETLEFMAPGGLD